MRHFVIYFILLLSACAHNPSGQAKYPIGSNKIVLLETYSTQAGLELDCKKTNQLIVKQLKSYGLEPLDIPKKQMEGFISDALQKVDAVYNPKTKQTFPLDRAHFLKQLAENIREHYFYALVIDSELLLREAQVDNNKVIWDGQKLPLKVHNKTKNTRLPQFAKGISLKVASINPQGEVVDIQFSGITLPYEIYAQNNQLKYQMKSAFFNESMLKKAIKSSMKPFYSRIQVTYD